MRPKYNKALIPFAKELRKDMTRHEKHLWYDYLKDYPVKFVRQKVLGYYIADFYCAKAKLAVELDGDIHAGEENGLYDMRRDEFISRYGVFVLRFSDNELELDYPGVCRRIDEAVKERIADRGE